MAKFCAWFAAALVLACTAPVLAQTADITAVPAAFPNAAGSSASAQPVENRAVIPALTPVSLEIMAPVGSKISKTGDRFPIRLAAPIVVGGKEFLPSGATGIGEVVHAKKSGGMGAAGELVLAARYLDVDGRRLALRSMNLVVVGKSNIMAVDTLNVASAASPIPIGLIGFFINGGQITVPQGALAQAKTRESFTVPTSNGTTPAAVQTADPTTGG